ncbi:MAG: MipA/OmpV family protein [Gammaproteobacteria bacterium]|nr:MipA/OmpV family protein [Gammaproteobacteria bacterium]
MKRLFKQLFISVIFINTTYVWAEHQPLWEIHAGLMGMQLPHYRGSNSYSTPIYPFPALIYRGERLKASDGKIQGLLYTSETVNLDVSLAGSLPASPDDNSAREGMPRLDTTFEIGPSLITNFWQSEDQNTRLSLELPIRAAFSIDIEGLAIRNRGWTFAPSISIKHHVNNWKGELLFGPVFADRRYHSYFYDVSTQYETSVRPTYDARSGYSGSRITLSIDKHFKRLSVIGVARYDVLSNAIFMDSPLIERTNNLSVGFVIMWQIAKAKRSTSHAEGKLP